MCACACACACACVCTLFQGKGSTLNHDVWDLDIVNTHTLSKTDLVDFTDEEGYGKFLDLHHLYDKYINLKQAAKMDYLTYLATFDRLFEIQKDKKNSEYKKLVTPRCCII